MKIYIIRHGKVDLNWSSYSDSETFDRECLEYDHAPIVDIAYERPQTDCRNICVSSLSRTRDTAVRIFGEAEYDSTPLIDEVPLRSAFDTRIRMPRWFWEVSGRVQWFFNSKRQKETRKATKARADRFIDKVMDEGSDLILVTHEFYMHTLLKRFGKRGFRIISKRRIHYRNGEYAIISNEEK
ncbi:MAG: histidine phosphatase family protein [Clostridiales bacterium]|nr:histidine phosphatase family protein [Clostridiales bacterium]